MISRTYQKMSVQIIVLTLGITGFCLPAVAAEDVSLSGMSEDDKKAWELNQSNEQSVSASPGLEANIDIPQDAKVITLDNVTFDGFVSPQNAEHYDFDDGEFIELLPNGDFESGHVGWNEYWFYSGSWSDYDHIISTSWSGYDLYSAAIFGNEWLESTDFTLPEYPAEIGITYNYKFVYFGSCSYGNNGVSIGLYDHTSGNSISIDTLVAEVDPYDYSFRTATFFVSDFASVSTRNNHVMDFNVLTTEDDPDCSVWIYIDNIHVTAANGIHEHNFVDRMYTRVLGRAADAGGVDYWFNRMLGGSSKLEVIKAFVDTNEYYRRYATGIYSDFLNRAPDPGGLDYWVGRMRNGLSMVALISNFAYSSEYLGQSNEDFVTSLYDDFMNRDADLDPGGYAYWVGQLNSENKTKRQIIADFFYSYEFNAKFVQEQYQQILGRGTDPAGEAYWVGQLQHGLDRKKLVYDLLWCSEFWNR